MKNKKTEEKKLNDLTPEMKERIMMMESQLADLRTNKQVTEQTI